MSVLGPPEMYPAMSGGGRAYGAKGTTLALSYILFLSPGKKKKRTIFKISEKRSWLSYLTVLW